jgi:LysR family hydrogen peroxide-inducible transcriptional activator
VVPTLKGIDLIAKAREILSLRKEFIQIAQERNNEVSGSFTLAITEILAPYLMPLFIRNMTRKYPNLELKILELSEQRIEDLLGSEGVDVAIMIEPGLKHDYFERNLYSEEILLYASNEMKKVSEDGKLVREQVDFDSIFIHEDLKEKLKLKIKKIFKNENALQGSRIKYMKGSLETIRNIIDHNGGMTLLPKIAEPYFSTKNQKSVYRFSGERLMLDVRLISTRGFEKNRIVKKLYEELRKIVTGGKMP